MLCGSCAGSSGGSGDEPCEPGSTDCDDGSTKKDASGGDEADGTETPVQQTEELLGTGGAAPEAAMLTVIASNKLNSPSDLEFHPDVPNQLWVANHANDSLSVIVNPGESNQFVHQFVSVGHHFLGEVVTLAFGDEGTFATCGESQNEEDPTNPPSFMGPALWSAELDDFLASPGNVDGIHWDMLHETPLCMGVAAESGNRFFVFNGLLGVIDWYDFKEPHVPGGTDHSDGEKKRFLSPGVKREPGVPSHLDYDAETGWLYVADTGNSRILRLDTNTGQEIGEDRNYSDEKPIVQYTGITAEQVVSAASGLLESPSGLFRHEGLLYVSDNATGKILAFDADGEVVNSLDTGLESGSLAGITVGPDNRLYFVDRLANQVLRIDPVDASEESP